MGGGGGGVKGGENVRQLEAGSCFSSFQDLARTNVEATKNRPVEGGTFSLHMFLEPPHYDFR